MALVLITGATSGIGKEFATKFAKKGFDLFLVARNKEKLNEIKDELILKYNINVEVLSIDLSLVDSPRKVYDYAVNKNLMVSVLINNAGFGDYGSFIEGDLDKYQNMIDLNNKALVSLTYYFIKDMKTNGYGHIINVASIAGFMPGPYMAIYYASKAFVLSFSLAIREELRKDNIHVTALCPGPVDTAFWQRAEASMSENKKKYLARSASEVASTGVKAFEDNRGLVVDGFINNLAILCVRLLPLEFASRVIGIIQGTLNKGEKHESSI